jgi:hypothetical protein
MGIPLPLFMGIPFFHGSWQDHKRNHMATDPTLIDGTPVRTTISPL